MPRRKLMLAGGLDASQAPHWAPMARDRRLEGAGLRWACCMTGIIFVQFAGCILLITDGQRSSVGRCSTAMGLLHVG